MNAATSSSSDDSDSSTETRRIKAAKSARRAKKERQKKRDIASFKKKPGMWAARKRTHIPREQEWPPQKCKHCIKKGRKKPHPYYPESKCFFNKKYKGFHPDWACEMMEVKFKPRAKFSAHMGGLRVEGDSSDTGSD